MAKKDFSTMNTDPVYNTIAAATAGSDQRPPEAQEAQENKRKQKDRRTYTPEEIEGFKESMQTAGRKGASLKRVNLAVSPSNYDYVITMSRVSGISLTEFINLCIRDHKEAHEETYNKALEFRRSL